MMLVMVKEKKLTINIKVNNIQNEKTFYTDSNGLELQKRVINL